ncbi:MAG: DUF4012 domain-containing protein [Parcubacteria group bacterium]|jgi:hypothetical protein
MDGVVRTKKYTARAKLSRHFSVGNYGAKSASAQESPAYRVYQLGKPYVAYDDCIGSDVRDGCPMTYDARTMLMKKEGDFVFSGESSLPRDLVDVVDEGKEWVEESDFAYDNTKEQARFRLKDIPVFVHESVLHPRHISFRYAVIMGCAVVSIGFFVFIGTVYAVREHVNDATERAIISIKSAMGSIAQNDFSSSGEELDHAYQDFAFASSEMGKINMLAKYIAQYVPGASRLASGDHIIEAGKFLTHTAKELHSIIPEVITDDHKLVSPDGKHVSFLALYQLLADRMDIARYDLAEAQKHIDQVYIDDVPEKYRDTFVQMKTILPEINTSLRLITESRPTVEDMLGANGPRTYLLLFQNNNEMRATGGFIGSYGIVKINNGRITQMMIDDVYNPDGQLIDRVVPPLPIQKISANWSMHDSNWFPNFPTSAKKTMDFYERSGGATVDGVIAITPELMKKLLEITGPVAVDGYDVTLTSDNFVQILQGEIEDESNYVSKTEESLVKNDNKEEKKEDGDAKITKKEKPKKILSDLMPIMIDRLFDRKSPEHLAVVARVVSESLKERHIMIYMTKPEAQKIIENNGWGGLVVDTSKDYLSVVNTNINGFKTDGVITETISHNAVIDQDGAIVDTVQIKRQHIGGHTGYPWWDAVNADYMRLYVPKGSELISVEGQTREINEERLAYDALGYEHDRDVKEEEQNMHIDEETGTRIYEQSDKTVFANWVYVSPQESVTVTYVYRLPFHVDMAEDEEGKFGSYAVLFQKQSGSVNSSIESTMALDKSFTPVWQAHDQGDDVMRDALTTDRYNGVVFRVE